MSENDYCHCVGTNYKVAVYFIRRNAWRGKDLRRPRKTDIEGADVTYLGRLSKYGHQQQARPDRNTTRSVAVSKKADRTVYDVWYRCRTELQKCRVWNSHGHTTMLPMAIPDEEISAVHWLCEQIMEWSCCSSRNPQPHEDFDTDTLSVNQPSTWCSFSPKCSAIGNAGAFGPLRVSIGARSWTNQQWAICYAFMRNWHRARGAGVTHDWQHEAIDEDEEILKYPQKLLTWSNWHQTRCKERSASKYKCTMISSRSKLN